MTTKQQLRVIRAVRDITQQQQAQEIGVCVRTLIHYEKGDRKRETPIGKRIEKYITETTGWEL